MQDFLASELPVKYHDGCTQEVLFFMLSCAASKDAAKKLISLHLAVSDSLERF